MAFDFPSSPTTGQTFSPVAGVTYQWNGYAWDLQGGFGGLQMKVVSFTRQMNFPSADVAVTGVGFKPVGLIIIGATGAASNVASWGVVDNFRLGAAVATFGTTTHYVSGNVINLWESSGVGQAAALKSFDADGFTLTWTTAGSPSTNVVTLYALCFSAVATPPPGAGLLLAPTVQRFLSPGAFTYNPTAGVKWIRVRGIAGGGGGASTNSAAAGGNGGNTTFGSLTFGAGAGGGSVTGGVGGTVSGSLPTGASWSLGPFSGAQGQGAGTFGPYNMGGSGGSSSLGGGGAGGGGQTTGYSAQGATGGGGGGGGEGSGRGVPGGGGGGGGASGEFIIANPAASYSGSVGGGGAPSGAGSEYNGGAGAQGGVWVEEHYNY